MKVFAKRKNEPAEPAPAPGPDLGGEILRLRGQIEAFIDAKVAELKASRDGASQPVDQLRMMLTQGSGCLCAVAMHILSERGDV